MRHHLKDTCIVYYDGVNASHVWEMVFMDPFFKRNSIISAITLIKPTRTHAIQIHRCDFINEPIQLLFTETYILEYAGSPGGQSAKIL